jgi:hypothetical protein
MDCIKTKFFFYSFNVVLRCSMTLKCIVACPGFRDSKYLVTPGLIAVCLDIHSCNHSYYKFTTSILTVLDIFCPATSSLSLISLSDPSLSVNSLSHSLNRILCRLKREHFIEQSGFIRCCENNFSHCRRNRSSLLR